MNIGSWFSKTAADTIPPDTVVQTRTLRQPLMPLLGNFFLKAQKEDGQWTVYRVAERPDGLKAEGDDDLVITQEKAKAGLNFIEMLVYLANFENAAPDLKYETVDPAEKEKLGFRHYQAFAHRQGFIFDKVSGRPVKTNAGEIQGTGTFAKTEVTLFRQHFELAKSQLELQTGDGALTQALMPVNGFQLGKMGSVFKMAKIRNTFEWFVGELERLKTSEIEWRRSVVENSKFEGSIKFEKLLETAESIDFLDKKSLIRGVHIFELFDFIESAQTSLHQPGWGTFEVYAKKAKETLKVLGLPKDFADAAMLRKPDLRNGNLWPPVEEFIKSCQGLRDTLNATLKAAINGEAPPAQKALPPPAVPLLPF